MKAGAQWIGLILVLFFSTPVLLRIQEHYGDLPVSLVGLVTLGMAAWVAGPEARALVETIRAVMGTMRLNEKDVANLTGMTPAQVSRQLNCEHQVSLSRWCEIPNFRRELGVQLLKEDGTHTVIENGLLARLVNKLEDVYEAATSSRRVA